MAWSERTKIFYAACAKRRGGELVGQIGNTQRAVLKLPCGHERTISVAALSGKSSIGAKPFKCFDCRLNYVQNAEDN